MKKTLLLMFCTMLQTLSLVYAQSNPTPSINLVPVPTPAICSRNTQAEVDIYGLPAQNLQLTIKLEITDAQNNVITPSFLCNNPGGGYEPIQITPAPVSQNATFTPLSGSNGIFIYQVNSQGNSIIRMSFEFYLDCSLIPSTPGTYFLRQTYFINGNPIGIINGAPVSASNQILSTLRYPHLVAIPMTNAIPGNYGQLNVEMLFKYQNTGTAPLNMAFEFTDLSGCAGTGYEVQNLDYSTTLGGLTNFNPYLSNQPFGNIAELAPGDFMYIKQIVKIKGCVNPCNPRRVQLQWQCHDNPTPSCENCQPVLTTNYTFSFEVPTFEVTRSQPTEIMANHDNSCPGTDLEWEVKIKNTSTFTTIPKIDVTTSQTDINTFTLISNGDLSNANLSSCSSCLNIPSLNTVVNSTTQVACSTSVNDAVVSFNHTIFEIGPGQEVSYTFKTIRCCDENPVFNNQEKLFNHWAVSAIGESACSTAIEPVIATASPIAIVSSNSISSHAVTPTADLNLDCSIIPTLGNMVIYPGVTGDPNICNGDRFSTYQGHFKVGLNGLIGNEDDLQVFGYQNPANIVSMVLRVKINCEKGLLIENPASVNISSVLSTQSQVWDQVQGTYHTSNADNCCDAYSDYYFYFDLASLVSNGNTVGLINDFFNWGRLNFDFMACCPTNLATTPYSIEFSVLLNENCYGFSPQGVGNIPTCSTATCC